MSGSFGEELKRLRLLSGKTQKQLADELGFRQPYIAALESGSGGVTASTLYNLCEALGVSCDHFREFLRGDK